MYDEITHVFALIEKFPDFYNMDDWLLDWLPRRSKIRIHGTLCIKTSGLLNLALFPFRFTVIKVKCFHVDSHTVIKLKRFNVDSYTDFKLQHLGLRFDGRTL